MEIVKQATAAALRNFTAARLVRQCITALVHAVKQITLQLQINRID